MAKVRLEDVYDDDENDELFVSKVHTHKRKNVFMESDDLRTKNRNKQKTNKFKKARRDKENF